MEKEQHARPSERHPVVSFNTSCSAPWHSGAGDLGADVISVEGSTRMATHCRGHLARRPERAAPVRQPQTAQRGIDLKSAKGREIALRLVDTPTWWRRTSGQA